MARAHFVKSARKDYPEHGIQKGEPYYWWKFMQGGRGGPKRFSKTRPKASQLTQSEFWSAVYGLQESADAIPSFEDLEGEIQSVIDELGSIRDDVQGKFDNLPENFQQGESGQRLEERISAIEDAISTLESIDTEYSEPDGEQEEGESDEDYESRKEDEIEQAKQEKAEEAWSEVVDALSSIGCE